MLIYKVANKVDGMIYVGQTSSTLDKRWNRHISEAQHGRGYYLARAIRKYGPENFFIEELHTCVTKEEMDFCEIFYNKFVIFCNKVYR